MHGLLVIYLGSPFSELAAANPASESIARPSHPLSDLLKARRVCSLSAMPLAHGDMNKKRYAAACGSWQRDAVLEETSYLSSQTARHEERSAGFASSRRGPKIL